MNVSKSRKFADFFFSDQSNRSGMTSTWVALSLTLTHCAFNQIDESERNHQVSIMSDIYSCARQVVNWLGPATPNTDLGMDILAFLFGDKDITFRPPWENYQASLLCAGLNDILKRTYFQRIWVVQENALASKIILQAGSRVITWYRGAATYKAICRITFAVISPSWELAGLQDVDMRPLVEILESNMMVVRRHMNKPCREVTILDLVFDMRYRKATKRRDMLFALRSMLPEEIRKHIVVDYSKSVEELYAEFYKEVKKAYMEEMNFVDISEKERLRKEKLNRARKLEANWGMSGW